MDSSPYDVLGVEPTASDAELHAAFRKRAYRLHPDRNSDPRAEEAMRALTNAWYVLGDRERRRAYDKTQEDGSGPPRSESSEPTGDGADDLDLWERDREESMGESEAVWLARRRSHAPVAVVVLVMLLAVLVITAYAGPRGGR